MNLDTQFREFMVSDSALVPLTATRWYQVQIPERPTYPLVAYQRISEAPLYSMNYGSGQANCGWYRYQITIIANGPSGGDICLAVRSAFVGALRRFNSLSGPGSPSTTDQAANIVLSGRLGNIPDPEQPKFTYVMDVRIFGQET